MPFKSPPIKPQFMLYGHANAHELKQIISEVNPKRVAFIHTERPNLYRRYIADLGIETVIPEEGKAIEV